VTDRPVVIGAGPNGLACAFVLARAGLQPLVLERAAQVGGAAVTGEIRTGVRGPILSHACDAVRGDLARDMALERRGVRFIRPAIASLTPRHDGPPLVIARDVRASVDHLRTAAPADAERWPTFHAELSAAARALAGALVDAPPSVDEPGVRDAWPLVRAARRIRTLGRRGIYGLIRALPMSAADFLEDWFASDTLRATLATRALMGSALGPRAGGTAGLLLLAAARQPDAPLAPTFVAGGPGMLTRAMADAVREAGGEVRTEAGVRRILEHDRRVRGVVLENGDEIEASTILSSADPQRTLLGLLSPDAVDPTLQWRLRNYRTNGTLAKVNLAVDGLPSFTGVEDGTAARSLLAGRVIIAPDIDALDRACDAAKYGELALQPWLECTIPSLTDSSLAPDGTHVVSIYAQAMPYALRNGTWDESRERLRAAVIGRLAEYAPDLPNRITAEQVLTPLDLEREHALTGGHVHHGDMALDQMYALRPAPACAQYRTPIDGLYLCGAGTHPGGGITGHSGVNAAHTFLRNRGRRSPR
jgi:phytoene dehydrogenase-like protein